MKTILLFVLLTVSSFSYAGQVHPHIDYVFPAPNVKFISTETTVILRLDRSLLSSIKNLSTLIRVSDSDGAIAGRTFFAEDQRTIIFKPNAPLQKNRQIDVRIQTSQFSGDDFFYSFRTVASSGNEIDWLQKPTAPTETLRQYAPVRVINGVAVPSDFPQISVKGNGPTAPGRIFFASTHINQGFGNYIVILENDGTPYFYRRYPEIPRTGNLTVHPNGELTFHCYETYYIMLDHHFVEVDTVYVGHGYYSDDHELQVLENGNILQVARQHVQVDMSKLVAGGQKNATVEAHHLIEMDKNRNIIFEWNDWEHLDIRDTFVPLTDQFVDFVHMNSIAVDYDGHLIISPREFKSIMKIHRDTGEVIWTLGGRNNDFTFINETVPFSFQHDARPVPGKPNHYTLFDNGRERQPQFSRGVEYKLDLQKMTAEKVWEYRHNPDWFSGWMGSVQRFDNGNTLIDFPGGAVRAIEVNSQGEEVWELRAAGVEAYRCRRFEWDGQMPQPYLILENMGSTVRLIFNKFGDRDVAFYNIYAGTNAGAMALLDSTGNTWFDIDALTLGNGSQYFFKVSAVSKSGVESGFSNVESAVVRVIAPGENAVQQGDFQAADAWKLDTRSGAQAVGAIKDGAYQITIFNGGSDLRHVILRQDNVMLMQNKDYAFEFDAYASQPRAVGAKIESVNSERINYGKIDNTALSTRPKHFRFEFPMRHPTDTRARVVFECGGSAGEVFIDNVSLTYQNLDTEPAPLPAPWQSSDIGQTAFSGAAGMRGERLLVRASGNDIWSQSDAFHFVYQEVQGDAEIIAQVYALEESDPWSKAGVMMRNSLGEGSRHAMMIMSAANGAAFQRRVKDRDESLHTAGSPSRAPHWVRLVRRSNTFQGYESSNGTDWTQVGTANIIMSSKLYVGLAVTAHNNSVICEAQFANVKLNGVAMSADDRSDAPSAFNLYPAFPNPFNAEAVIRFALPSAERVVVKLFDLRGRELQTLIDDRRPAGLHETVIDAADYASGVYFVRLQAGRFSANEKIMLIK